MMSTISQVLMATAIVQCQAIEQTTCSQINVSLGQEESAVNPVVDGFLQPNFDLSSGYPIYELNKDSIDFFIKGPLHLYENAKLTIQKDDLDSVSSLLYKDPETTHNLNLITESISIPCNLYQTDELTSQLLLKFNDCPYDYPITFSRKCYESNYDGQPKSDQDKSTTSIANTWVPQPVIDKLQSTDIPANLRVIEADSIFSRPVLFENSTAVEELQVIPESINQIYLKFELDSYMQGPSSLVMSPAPYIKNFNNLADYMYPVLVGSAAKTSILTRTFASNHLLIEFNCLGQKTTQDIDLVIPMKHHDPLSLKFTKHCAGPSVLTVIEEEMVESKTFGLFMFLLIATFAVSLTCCIFNIKSMYDQNPQMGIAYLNQRFICSLHNIGLNSCADQWQQLTTGHTSQLDKANSDNNKFLQQQFGTAFDEEIVLQIEETTDDSSQDTDKKSLSSQQKESVYGGI